MHTKISNTQFPKKKSSSEHDAVHDIRLVCKFQSSNREIVMPKPTERRRRDLPLPAIMDGMELEVLQRQF